MLKSLFASSLILAASLCAVAAQADDRTFEGYGVAVLQGLDKPNARVLRFEVPIGKDATFGPLVVRARTCKKTAPEDTPESAAFLEIEDTRVTGAQRKPAVQRLDVSPPALRCPALQSADFTMCGCWIAKIRSRSRKWKQRQMVRHPL